KNHSRRYQAGKHFGDARRPSEAGRLWHRALLDANVWHSNINGNSRVSCPRANPWSETRCPFGPLFARCSAVSDGVPRPPIQRHFGKRGLRTDHFGSAAATFALQPFVARRI